MQFGASNLMLFIMKRLSVKSMKKLTGGVNQIPGCGNICTPDGINFTYCRERLRNGKVDCYCGNSPFLCYIPPAEEV